MYFTYNNIIHLRNSKIWILDGTFKIVPYEFTQLVTIQASVYDKFIPLVYCLLQSKSADAYIFLLDMLKNKFNSRSRNSYYRFRSRNF